MLKQSLKILILSIILLKNSYAIDELIVRSENSKPSTFENRFSFLLGVNPRFAKPGDLSNLAFSYGQKQEDFWLDTNVLITNGLFNKISTNNTTATGLTDDELIDTKSSMTTLGIGIGRESYYIQNLLSFESLYEVTAVNFTYNIFKENTSDQTFTGPGMLAKFSLYKKISDYCSFGPQVLYNLAVVKREATEDLTESSSERSLTMSTFTFGFDLSFFL